MTDAVSICNGALILLGAETITAFSDHTKNARVMNERYDAVRRRALRKNRWRFSIKRTSLAALSQTPESDYWHQYQLPNDFIRLIEGGDIYEVPDLSDLRTSPGSALYSIEGRVILTDLGAPLAIRYIADITDPSMFDVCFVQSLEADLAYECCETITQSDSKQQLARQRYKEALRDATVANALEVAKSSIADHEWVAARSQ
jgi:hypothetical protein